MFLGLLDPDPLVRGMDPDPDPALDPNPDPSIIMQRKTLIPTILRLFLTFYLRKMIYVNVASRSNKQKKLY
jgi:hypothetical protein